VALASLLGKDLRAQSGEEDGGDSQRPHTPPRAAAVIFINMAGAPPQLDMFDYKPVLQRYTGQQVPESLTKGERFSNNQSASAKLLGSPYTFQRHGKAGIWLSSIFEHMPDIADDICVIPSVHTDQFNHAPAALKLFTGFPRAGRPSMGAWVTYGLGSEAADLPGFVVMSSGRGARCGFDCFGPGFLPSVYQGVTFNSRGEPVLYLNNPAGISRAVRRKSLDTLRALNEAEFEAVGDPEIQTRIAAYELGYRMQAAVPELADISREPRSVHELYGTEPGKKSFSNNCLLARRLVERGVRFVQLNHGEWDMHGGRLSIPTDLPRLNRETERGTVALVKDLQQRGLLRRTLVVWGAEFGRTPMLEGKMGPKMGRDHHKTFTVWLAGGGVRRGFVYGATDELGYHPTVDPMHVHDLQATVLHILGLNHEELTYKFQGRPFRLTDEHGSVHERILA
jgi:hypothetical protein